MTRRVFNWMAALGIGAFEKVAAAEPVTEYVAGFVVNTGFGDIPPEVIELARKSILDGLGLALCGSVAKSGEIVRTYLQANGLVTQGPKAATVIGSALKAPV